MLDRDTPSHPMVFEITFEIVGEIDKSAVQESLDFLIERHPLAVARVCGDHWVLPAEQKIPVHWGPSPPESIDLKTQGGIRLAIDKTQIRFEFHHATTDAEGASLFVRDFVQAYGERTGGEVRRWSRHDTKGLLQRHIIPWPKASQDTAPLGLWKRLRFALEVVGRLPEQLQGDILDKSARTRPICSHTFTVDQTRRISEVAQETKVNLASVSFSLLFQTLARWQTRCGVSPGFRKLRILVPTSIRQLSDFRMGCCNRNSFAFLTRSREKALACQYDFIKEMNEEMKFIRTSRPDLTTLLGLEWAHKFHLLSLVGRLPNFQSTAALTYLGDFSNSRQHEADQTGIRVGDLLVTRIAGSPPITSGTRLAFAVNKAGERMSVGLRSDAQTFSVEGEREIVRSYAQAWADWAGFHLES